MVQEEMVLEIRKMFAQKRVDQHSNKIGRDIICRIGEETSLYTMFCVNTQQVRAAAYDFGEWRGYRTHAFQRDMVWDFGAYRIVSMRIIRPGLQGSGTHELFLLWWFVCFVAPDSGGAVPKLMYRCVSN